MIRRIIPFILSAIVLAAHFLRFANFPIMIFSLAVPFLLLIKKRWALLTVQALTVAGGLFWIKVAVDNLWLRLAVGEPWLRMVAILLAVSLFTLWSAWLLASDTVAEKYL